jgi:hypothetical protein
MAAGICWHWGEQTGGSCIRRRGLAEGRGVGGGACAGILCGNFSLHLLFLPTHKPPFPSYLPVNLSLCSSLPTPPLPRLAPL